MRVALLQQTHYLRRPGTSERYRDGLATHLAANGDDVTTVLNDTSFAPRPRAFKTVHVAAKGGRGWFPVHAARWLARNRQDVVIALTPGAVLAAKGTGHRVVYREDGIRASDEGRPEGRQLRTWRAAVAAADGVLCHTEEHARAVRELGARRVVVVPHGVYLPDKPGDAPQQAAGIANGWPLSAAGISGHFPVLVSAFEKVIAQRPDARLVVPQHIPYDGMPSTLPPAVTERLTVRPFVVGPEPPPIVPADAALAVIDPGHEALARSQEALAQGRPVVAPRASWFDRTVPDRFGRPYATGDEDSLAQAIIDVLVISENPGTSAACHAHAARWSWPEVGPRVAAFLADVLSS